MICDFLLIKNEMELSRVLEFLRSLACVYSWVSHSINFLRNIFFLPFFLTLNACQLKLLSERYYDGLIKIQSMSDSILLQGGLIELYLSEDVHTK